MKGLIHILAVFAWVAGGVLDAQAAGLSDKRVLVVHSYHKTQEGHVVEMDQGLEQAFADSDTVMRYVYMDTKRKPGLVWKEQAGQIAFRAMEEFHPGVVIAMDDNAQAYFVKKAMTAEDAPVFIFGGGECRSRGLRISQGKRDRDTGTA